MDRQVPCGRLVLFTMKVWPSPSAYGMTNIMKGLKGTLVSFRDAVNLGSLKGVKRFFLETQLRLSY